MTDSDKKNPQCLSCNLPIPEQEWMEEAVKQQTGYAEISRQLENVFEKKISPDAISNHVRKHLAIGTPEYTVSPEEEIERVEIDNNGEGVVTTRGYPEEKLISDADTLLRNAGLDPEAFDVIGDMGVATWNSAAYNRSTETWDKVKLHSYRIKVRRKTTLEAEVNDLFDLIKDVGQSEGPHVSGEHAFVFASGDLQLGKPDADGLEGIVSRYVESVEKAVLKVKEMQHLIGPIVISWVGDCIEGSVSQGGKNAGRNEISVTMQVRTLRRLMMETIKAFAPLTNDLRVVSVPGNHDEAQREPVSTDPSDSWAVDSLVAVSDALELNPEAFGHVSCEVVPYDEMTTTIEAAGTIITHAHGHQWKRDKHWDWWKGQKWGGHEPGDAHILLCGHYHSGTYAQQNTDKHFVQVPSFEKESTYFRHKTGLVGNPSAVTFLTKDGKLKYMDFE